MGHTHSHRKDILVNIFICLPVFNILVNVGVVLTYPILISIGTLLSVPGNAGKCRCACVSLKYV